MSDGFPKKRSLNGGWVGGWGEFYAGFVWDFLNFINFAKPLMTTAEKDNVAQ